MVAMGSYRSDGAVVGRDRERDLLIASLRSAVSGVAQAALLVGDAGIGKTLLLKSVLDDMSEDGCLVLRGTCLPLTSLSIPFLGIRSALDSLASAGAGAALPPPPDIDARPALAPVALDRWIGDIAASRPCVLAIDDLHWADSDTLDALLYLGSGPATRRFALVGTVRAEESARETPVGSWIAQLHRFPRFQLLELGPLDRAATAELIGHLLGGAPAQTLVEDVYRRSRGHPYLTELMVAGLSPAAARLPDEAAETVGAAVLDAVRRLSPATRHLLEVLALAARPMTPEALVAALGTEGRPPSRRRIEACLHEAVACGVVNSEGRDGYWFRHPLTAEAIEARLSDDERRRWHRVMASSEEADIEQPPALERALRIAAHWEGAGDATRAYGAELVAAAAAEGAGAYAAALRALLRARDLLDAAGHPADRPALIRRVQVAAAEAGDLDAELACVDELLAHELSASDRAFFTYRRQRIRAVTQRATATLTECEELVHLTEAQPESRERALALVEWANALKSNSPSDDRTGDVAARALTVARRSGDPLALANALVTAGDAARAAGDPQRAAALAAEAIPAALAAHDWVAFNNASEELAWNSPNASLREGAALFTAQREALVAHEAPHAYVAWLASWEAHDWLTVGDWRRCEAALRFVVTSDPGRYSEASARITAARLAVLQGRLAEAEAHLAPVGRLAGTHPRLLLLPFDAVRAQLALAQADTEGAFRAALEGVGRPEPPELAEWLLPLAARALADHAEACRRRGSSDTGILERVEALAREHPRPLSVEPESELRAQRWAPAFAALYAGELARARGLPDEEWRRWSAAVEEFARIDLPWDECYCCLRAAEAALRGAVGMHHRGSVRSFLFRGHELAAALHAGQLLAAFQQLAQVAHVPLSNATPSAPAHAVPLAQPDSPRLATLTDREHEVLARIAAGRTYAEVARELFISEKTVSAHVSHMLAKTGTSNRVELALLARSPAGSTPESAVR